MSQDSLGRGSLARPDIAATRQYFVPAGAVTSARCRKAQDIHEDQTSDGPGDVTIPLHDPPRFAGWRIICRAYQTGQICAQV
jgi:hypothetical protein